MSDDELRAAERDLERTPHDAALRARLGRSLARAGQRRRAWAELARAAREGDQDARAEVAGWGPWFDPWLTSRRAPRGLPRRLRPPRRVDLRAVAPPCPALVGATDERLYLEHGDELAAVDLAALAPSWQRETRGSARARQVGDDLLTLEEGALLLRAGATGEVVERAPLPAGTRLLFTHLDRALVRDERELALVDLAPGRLGRVVVREPAPTVAQWRALDEGLVSRVPDRLRVQGLDDGAVMAERRLDRRQTHELVSADRRGVIVKTMSYRGYHPHVRELSLPDLAPRWSVPFRCSRGAALVDDALVVFGKARGSERTRLAVFDREGRPRWEGPEVGAIDPVAEVLVDARTLVVVNLEPAPSARLEVQARDLTTGAVLGEQAVDLRPLLAEGGSPHLRLSAVALGERLLVAASVKRRMALLLFE